MSAAEPLVTVAMPVFNGADSIESTARSVLAQDYPNIELLISDNASTDDTEAIARNLAAADPRVRYHRHLENVGLLSNFDWTKAHAQGTYLRWIGDDDELSPTCISRCLETFRSDPRLILVTTQLEYVDVDGRRETMRYDATPFTSSDPAVRFTEMLRMLTASHLLIDPIYGLARREAVAAVVHDRMLRGDEVYAAKLALAGPWGHIAEPLGMRHWSLTPRPRLVQLLDVAPWEAHLSSLVQAGRLASAVRQAELAPAQRHAALAAVARLYGRRKRVTAARRSRKLVRLARAALAR